MDEKSDIGIGLNEIVVPKNKQGSYWSNDYLCSLELATELSDPKFGMASHFFSSCNSETDNRNQTKHHYIQEAFIDNIAKIVKAQIRCTQYEFMNIFMVPIIHAKNASHPPLTWNDNQFNLFLHWDSFTFNNSYIWQYCINKRHGT